MSVDGEARRGFPTPSGLLEFYSTTVARWGWPELALPTYQRSHVHPAELGRRRAGADLDLPPADPDPHPQRQLQVAQRARPTATRCGCTPTTPRRLGRAHRRPGAGEHRDRSLRRQGLGDRGHPPGRRRLQPPHGPVEAEAGDAHRRWADLGDGRPGQAGQHVEPEPDPRASRPIARPTRTPAGSGGPTSACTRTSPSRCTRTRSRACTAGTRRCGSPGPEPATPTATSWSTPSWRTRPTCAGWPRPAGAAEVSPDGTRRPYWLMRPLKPGPEVYRLPARASG